MLKPLISKWWFKWLLIGIVIRVILMPVTLHPDMWGHSFVAYFFAYEGKLNPYETLAALPQTHPLVRNFGVTDIFIYPPLAYFTLGFFRLLVRPFVDPAFLPFVMEYPGRVFDRPDLLWNLFIFKLPYLFVDVALAFLLAGIFNDPKKKRCAFILWMLNPVTIYATFMIGQIDILPTFFTVLAAFLYSKNKKTASLVSLGIGASYKLWPALLIVPAAFLFEEKLINRIKSVLIGFLPLILTFLPYLNSKAFRYMVFSPKSQKMLFMNLPVSGAEGIYPFIFILVLIYLYIYYKKAEKVSLSFWFLSILLLIFSVTHYHPQWFLWVTPFLIWQLVEVRFKYWELVCTLLASWLFITLMFEPSLSIGLFAPINPKLVSSIGLADILTKYVNVFEIKSIVRSIFAASSLFYLVRLKSGLE
jgi:hypothetical protein